MEEILSYLEKLGVAEAQARFYLNLLKAGPKRVVELSSLFNLNRTTIYLYLNDLTQHGLITKSLEGSRVLIAANDPKTVLPTLVEEEITSRKKMKDNLSSIVSNISRLYPVSQNSEFDKSDMRYFKGRVWQKKIYEEALSGKEFCGYAKCLETEGYFSTDEDFFNKAFKRNPNLNFRHILYDFSFSKGLPKHFKNKKYVYKILPKNSQLVSEDILIYDGKVAILNYIEDESTVLTSDSYYKNSKQLFDYIWNTLPNPK